MAINEQGRAQFIATDETGCKGTAALSETGRGLFSTFPVVSGSGGAIAGGACELVRFIQAHGHGGGDTFVRVS